MSAARADPDLLARITEWVGDGALALADLGYEGEPDIFRIPFKKPADTTLTVDQQAYNTVHGGLHSAGWLTSRPKTTNPGSPEPHPAADPDAAAPTTPSPPKATALPTANSTSPEESAKPMRQPTRKTHETHRIRAGQIKVKRQKS